MRVAVLEDEPIQAHFLERCLNDEGHEVEVFQRGDELQRHAAKTPFDLFILDWIVPEVSGINILRYLRGELGSVAPVIFVTSMRDEKSAVEALGFGADDYVRKPVCRAELVARTRALVRRLDDGARADQSAIGAYTFERSTSSIRIEGREGVVRVVLTQKEFDLAAYLFRNVGRVVSRAEILTKVWSGPAGRSRTLDTHISKLRTRLDLAGAYGFALVTVHKIGYRLSEIDPGERGAKTLGVEAA